MQLMILAKASSLHHWKLHAASNKALWTVRCSVAPDADIWTLSEWTNHPKHVLLDRGTAQAIEAIRAIPDKSWRRQITSALPKDPQLLELAAVAAKTFRRLWLQGRNGGGVLHQTCNAVELCGWLSSEGLDPREILLKRDFWGRNALHITAEENRLEDVRYLAQLEPEAAQQCDRLGSNPTALATGEARELLCSYAEPVKRGLPSIDSNVTPIAPMSGSS